MIDALTIKPPFSRPWMPPGFAMPEDSSQDVWANENIHCDEDENLWSNPQDRVEGNIEVQ